LAQAADRDRINEAVPPEIWKPTTAGDLQLFPLAHYRHFQAAYDKVLIQGMEGSSPTLRVRSPGWTACAGLRPKRQFLESVVMAARSGSVRRPLCGRGPATGPHGVRSYTAAELEKIADILGGFRPAGEDLSRSAAVLLDHASGSQPGDQRHAFGPAASISTCTLFSSQHRHGEVTASRLRS